MGWGWGWGGAGWDGEEGSGIPPGGCTTRSRESRAQLKSRMQAKKGKAAKGKCSGYMGGKYPKDSL